MLGNFAYCNPTKLYFGDESLQYLNTELPKYGKNVVLIYGGGSIKKNGIYDEVVKALEANGKNVAEISGVMPNLADENIMPKFSILNPRYTLTLPHYQMVSGIYDIFNHICEQYFSGEDDNTSDYISEGLMRSVIHSKMLEDLAKSTLILDGGYRVPQHDEIVSIFRSSL